MMTMTNSTCQTTFINTSVYKIDVLIKVVWHVEFVIVIIIDLLEVIKSTTNHLHHVVPVLINCIHSRVGILTILVISISSIAIVVGRSELFGICGQKVDS